MIKIVKKNPVRNFFSNGTGFTLLELIIVIVIVGILASIGFVWYTTAIEKQKGYACANNFRTVFMAWEIYNRKTDPDYNPNAYVSITGANGINDKLGTRITEKYFGRGWGHPNFSYYTKMASDANGPYLYLSAYKQFPPNENKNLKCRYYYQTGEYDWSTGTTWPWPPED